jgi:exopolysaccharide biosynthesis protein
MAEATAVKPMKRKRFRPLFTFLNIILIILFWIIVTLLGTIMLFLYGPSEYYRGLFVTTVMETSAAKILATGFLGEERVQEILSQNTVIAFKEVTNTDLIETPDSTNTTQEELDSIIIEDVSGSTYKGKIMIIRDPSRLYVGVTNQLGVKGERTDRMVKREDAIAGVNGGGFVDEAGMGHGGDPLGIVIQHGKLITGELNKKYELIGFNKENVLVLGTYTGQEALDIGIRDAISFGPFYIVNGEAAPVVGTGGGLNPRTVIGQKKDGTVLLLVIDGRQSSSLGATYKDCLEVMLRYEAYNAANLDGGTSSVMVYEDKIINSTFALYGARAIPTSILIKK